MNAQESFVRVARRFSEYVGSPVAFAIALMTILVWAISGPFFDYSDTWQLIINTGTTIITFLMVFLIQNAQNRDARALHLKLDELIRGVRGARNELVNLEEMSDEELEKLHTEFRLMHSKIENHLIGKKKQTPHYSKGKAENE